MIEEMLNMARKAAVKLLALSDDTINAALRAVADALDAAAPAILEANAADLEDFDAANPMYDRLRLTPGRIASMASDIRSVATLPSPRRVLESAELPNGLRLRKMAVPFGVVGVIYEARPNVTSDVFSICFKSGNACVLKGSHSAHRSNVAIVAAIKGALEACGVTPDAVTLLPPDREATSELLTARGMVDLIIPRGSRRLIDSVRAQATVPVIETGAGVCHCVVDSTADAAMARDIIDNAKTRRVSVCNALDCAVILADALPKLPVIAKPLAEKGVVIHADPRAYAELQAVYPAELLKEATAEDFGTEFLSMAMAVKTVDTFDEAVDYIAGHGSGHSEALVTATPEHAERFWRDVDAACVYVNAPTSFTDGAQFGLGAEIGISTQKLHARGPMALRELMTYKWLIEGQGQIRP